MLRLLVLFLMIVSSNINQLHAQWDKIYKEVNGLCVAFKSNKYGYVDKTGKTVIAAKYDDAFDFKDNGFAKVKLGEKFGLIDNENKVDGLIVAVGHNEFRSLSAKELRSYLNGEKPVIGDVKSIYNKEELISEGFSVFRL